MKNYINFLVKNKLNKLTNYKSKQVYIVFWPKKSIYILNSFKIYKDHSEVNQTINKINLTEKVYKNHKRTNILALNEIHSLTKEHLNVC